MTLRQYLAFMSTGTILAWVAWGMVVRSLDPFMTGTWSKLIFFASLLVALVGTFTVCGFIFRAWVLHQKEVIFKNVRKTFRHGIFFAIIICLALFLKAMGIFYWWVMLVFIFGIGCLELFFLSRQRLTKFS